MASKGAPRKRGRVDLPIEGFSPADSPGPAARRSTLIDDFVATGEECVSMALPTEEKARRAAQQLHRLRRSYMARRQPGEPEVRTAKRGLSVYIFRDGKEERR